MKNTQYINLIIIKHAFGTFNNRWNDHICKDRNSLRFIKDVIFFMSDDHIYIYICVLIFKIYIN